MQASPKLKPYLTQAIAVASLYQRLGGKFPISLAVEDFYRRVLNDERVSHFFANTNMAQQKKHQKAFMAHLFGSTKAYASPDLSTAHSRLVSSLNLSNEHIDIFAQHLRDTLSSIDLPADLIDEVMDLVDSPQHRSAVLGESS